MSGKPKMGLDYAAWDVNIFDGDRKIDLLLDAQGWKGFGIYFYLCQTAYKLNGYYLEWDFADCASVARRLGCGVSSDSVRSTVTLCFQIGLFDKRLFDGCGVLTSRGIQRRFWMATAKRQPTTIRGDIWVLPEDDTPGFEKRALIIGGNTGNAHSRAENAHSRTGNAHSRAENATKESKVKKSKGLDSAYAESSAEPLPSASTPPDACASADTGELRRGDTAPQAVITLPLNDGTEHTVTGTQFTELQSLYPAVDVLQQLRNMRGWLISHKAKRKTKRGINAFITSWLSREQDRSSGYGFPPWQGTAPRQQTQNRNGNGGGGKFCDLLSGEVNAHDI